MESCLPFFFLFSFFVYALRFFPSLFFVLIFSCVSLCTVLVLNFLLPLYLFYFILYIPIFPTFLPNYTCFCLSFYAFFPLSFFLSILYLLLPCFILFLSCFLDFRSSVLLLLTWSLIPFPTPGKHFRRLHILTRGGYYLHHVCPSVRLSFCMHQLIFHWTDFRCWTLI